MKSEMSLLFSVTDPLIMATRFHLELFLVAMFRSRFGLHSILGASYTMNSSLVVTDEVKMMLRSMAFLGSGQNQKSIT